MGLPYLLVKTGPMGNKAQGYVLVIANWDFPLDGGSIFTTELTIMGLLFQ